MRPQRFLTSFSIQIQKFLTLKLRQTRKLRLVVFLIYSLHIPSNPKSKTVPYIFLYIYPGLVQPNILLPEGCSITTQTEITISRVLTMSQSSLTSRFKGFNYVRSDVQLEYLTL